MEQRREGNSLNPGAPKKREPDREQLRKVHDNDMDTEELVTGPQKLKNPSRAGARAMTKPEQTSPKSRSQSRKRKTSPSKSRNKSKRKANRDSSSGAIVNELSDEGELGAMRTPNKEGSALTSAVSNAVLPVRKRHKTKLVSAKSAQERGPEDPKANLQDLSLEPIRQGGRQVGITPKKQSREPALMKQEIKEMNREKRSNILESITSKTEDKKSANRLEQIMENVKIQRAQYSHKKAVPMAEETIPTTKPTSNVARLIKQSPKTNDNTDLASGSMRTFEYDASRDESIGGSTLKPGSLFSNMSQNQMSLASRINGKKKNDPLRKLKNKVEEISEESEFPETMNLRERPPGMPKLNFEIGLMKERKHIVDSAELIKKMNRLQDDSFSIDVDFE